jgi:hypothetical protein
VYYFFSEGHYAKFVSESHTIQFTNRSTYTKSYLIITVKVNLLIHEIQLFHSFVTISNNEFNDTPINAFCKKKKHENCCPLINLLSQ